MIEVVLSDEKPLLDAFDENSNIKERNRPPSDQYNIVYMLFLLQGIGMLLPWNFFITANEYFKNKFETDQSAKETFENAFSVGSQVPTSLFILINLCLTGRVSRGLRVISSLLIATGCFILTTVLVNVESTSWTHKFFLLTVATVVVINSCSGIYQGTLLGIAGAVGPQYIQGTMVGLALGGVCAALASFASLAASSNIHVSAVGYFSTGSVVLFVCCVTYVILMRTPYVQYYLLQTSRDEENKTLHSQADYKEIHRCRNQSIDLQSKSIDRFQHLWMVFRKIYPLALAVCFTFTIQLTLMPALLSGIKTTAGPSNSKWNKEYFATLVCFLLFSTGDMVGRIVAGMVQIVNGKDCKLVLICLSRVIFVPLFMLCNYQPRHHLPVYFNSDYIPVFFNTVFAFTNGYFGTLCMMFGPQLVEPRDMETAGVVMQLFLSLGLALGSALSYPLVALI